MIIDYIITSWSSVWLSWRTKNWINRATVYLESCDELLWNGAKQPISDRPRRWLKYSGKCNLPGDLFLEPIFQSCSLFEIRFVVGRPFVKTVTKFKFSSLFVFQNKHEINSERMERTMQCNTFLTSANVRAVSLSALVGLFYAERTHWLCYDK